MSEYVDFHYMPLEGKITGKQVLKQTEDAINDLGQHVYEIDIDNEKIQEAIDTSNQAIDTAEAALSAVTTNRAMWFNTVAEMKATDIALGITAATRGEGVFNDGDGAFYAVRSIKGGDVDGENTVFLDNGNVAERIRQFNLIAKGNKYIANVAELRTIDAEIGDVYATKGYYTENDGGNGFYIIRADAGDTDDGGSVIILDNGNVAELIVTDEVNINQFGGVGDGTTDDNVAIVNAVAYASAKNYRLVFLEGYTYYTSLGIVIANPPTEIRMDGALYYTGSGTALTIGQASAGNGNKILKIFVRGSNSHTAGSNGVLLYNLPNSNIYLYDVRYFGDTAVELRGENRGFGYNTVHIGMIYSSPILLKLNSVGSGWVNDNKFFGGRLAVQSNDSFKDTVVGILITGDYSNNNNNFYAPSLELRTSVKIERGNCNNFFDCRTEGSTNAMLIDYSVLTNTLNYMSTYLGAVSDTELQKDKYGNVVKINNANTGNLNSERLSTVVFDSRTISENIASNNSNTSVGGLLRINKGTLYDSFTATSVQIVDGLMTMKSTSNFGICVDTTKQKTFVLDLDMTGSHRYRVFMWDSTGTPIDDTVNPPTSEPRYNNRFTLSYLSSSGAGASQYSYGTTADGENTSVVFALPSNCAKAFIFVSRGSGDCVVKRVVLRSTGLCQIYGMTNNEYASLDAIPTSVGVKGQFVKKTTPTADCIGWIYDGTNWLPMPGTPISDSSAPSTGDHVVGEIVYNSSPTAGGYVGWVCVTAGTPGTWKGFGEIEA